MYYLIFRVLGKFGGGNRKMMTEPQRLDYSIHRQSKKPAIVVKFNEHPDPVTFNVDMVCIIYSICIELKWFLKIIKMY